MHKGLDMKESITFDRAEGERAREREGGREGGAGLISACRN